MKLPRRTFLHLAVGVAALPAVSHIARAQTYPTRPITIVAPFAAGGPTDAIGRLLAQQMGSSLGQTVIVENVTGAGGTIGVARAARAVTRSAWAKTARTSSPVRPTRTSRMTC